jgi:hypothetical protein
VLPGRLLDGRAQGPGAGRQDAVGEGDGRVAVVLLLQYEKGGRGVVANQRALQGLAGHDDQALAVGLGRLGELGAGGVDQGAELGAGEEALDLAPVAALAGRRRRG